jgi:adenine-specific DNA-methyltransferase
MEGAEASLLDQVESLRLDAGRSLPEDQRAELGQFLTPPAVCRYMAALADPASRDVRLLDPGAGVGSLSAAWIGEMLGRRKRPRSIRLTAFEIDHGLAASLRETVAACQRACGRAGIEFSADIVEGDFIARAVGMLATGSLFGMPQERFNCAIMNPPYRKIGAGSEARHFLHTVGIETSNLYTAFLWLVLKLLDADGELVAITPRSFCNGPYFRPFRQALLREATITRIHVFGSRKVAFRESDVLQENVIFRASKAVGLCGRTIVSTSDSPEDTQVACREVRPDEMVLPDDPDQVIHLVPDDESSRVARCIRSLKDSLDDLRIQVSTGRVVDFRAKRFLVFGSSVPLMSGQTVPLIYPMHFDRGAILWPRKGKKPDRLLLTDETRPLLVPSGVYVLVKRFSAKEEKRRVCAAVCHSGCLPPSGLAFENHLNYYHQDGKGIPSPLAMGLAAYLNSTLVDSYFRQFSGHTQVNASDLRALPYPGRATLTRIGEALGTTMPPQDDLDRLVSRELGV